MKIFKKKSGFTAIEVVVTLGLVGSVLMGSWAYLKGTYKDTDNLVEKIDVQKSVTSLMMPSISSLWQRL